jgi:hypothetical protein
MRKIAIFVFVSVLFIACDTGTNSDPVNPLVGTWYQIIDNIVYVTIQ